MQVRMIVEEERMDYLPGNCRKEPIIDYITSQFANEDIGCSMKCNYWPKGMVPQFDKAFKDHCPDDQSWNCVFRWGTDLMSNAKKYCHAVSYSGEISTTYIHDEIKHWCSEVNCNILTLSNQQHKIYDFQRNHTHVQMRSYSTLSLQVQEKSF